MDLNTHFKHTHILTLCGHSSTFFLSAVSDNTLVPNVSIDDLKQMKVGNLAPFSWE